MRLFCCRLVVQWLKVRPQRLQRRAMNPDFFVGQSHAHRFGRRSGRNTVGRYVLGDNRACGDDGALTDVSSVQDDTAMSNPYIILDDDRPGLGTSGMNHWCADFIDYVIAANDSDIAGEHDVVADDQVIDGQSAVISDERVRADRNRSGPKVTARSNIGSASACAQTVSECQQ